MIKNMKLKGYYNIKTTGTHLRVRRHGLVNIAGSLDNFFKKGNMLSRLGLTQWIRLDLSAISFQDRTLSRYR